jgi:hypothetical protein
MAISWPGTTAGTQNSVSMLFIKKPVMAAGNDTGMGSYALTTVFGMVTADFPDAAAGQTFYISAKPAGIASGPLMVIFLTRRAYHSYY